MDYRPLVLGLALLAACASAATAQNRVGVAGAVNPDADFNRGGATRTVVIGDNVLFRDRIVTSGAGLVNVLFVDGSAFTVGPNARVVIDEFVFDPATGAGSLVAEVTSGALRFVGGRLSKQPGGVRFGTPAGTLGVRGGIANIDLGPSCLEDGRCPRQTASFVFGEELTVTTPDGRTRRISQEGYSFAFFNDGSLDVVPTDLLDISSLQARLSSRAGQDGGADDIPSEGSVEDSGIVSLNSALSPIFVLPRRKPFVVTSRVLPSDDDPQEALPFIDQVFRERGRSDALRNNMNDDAHYCYECYYAKPRR